MNSKRCIIRSLIAGTILALSILAAAAETPKITAGKTGRAPVNGLNLCHEIYEAGETLALLFESAEAAKTKQ